MQKLLLAVSCAVLMSTPALSAETEVQTSWYLGPGQLGPVLHWGEEFYASDSLVHSVPGQLTLMAASVDYDSWTKHTVELNPNIEAHVTIMPADLDQDGDLDLVAVLGGTENAVVWYERTGAGYVKHVAGSFLMGPRATTFAWDYDGDGDTDILASGGEGLAWFENENAIFTKHTIDASMGYLYARPGDVDNDGDVDAVAHDVSEGNMWGDLWLFRNDGSMGFEREFVYNTTGHDIWRINLADFSGDGFLDIQTSDDPVWVFLNDGSGNFIVPPSYVYDPGQTVDGSWPNDFDADGDVDIMGAVWGGGSGSRPLFWLENDGTGINYAYHVIGGESGDYGDGGMATDVNLDGLMDALGTYRYVGWFEQTPLGTFVEHQLPDGYFYHSHWVYGENLDGGPCTGEVDIDILATKDGEFAWWENHMVTFAARAWLESSILDAGEIVSWQRFGWEDHIPIGNEIRYRVRSGATVADLLASPWSSPILFSGDTLYNYGVSAGQYFQYRIEFQRFTQVADRSPTVYEVWVEWGPYVPPALVTGGGWIPGEASGPSTKRTFGFNAHSQAGYVWGQLQFIDHALKMKVHSDTISAVVVQPGDTIANFSGDCRVDGVMGYSFDCEVMDRGEPGHYVDWFSIDISGPGGFTYSAGDWLGGGNIQIHDVSVGPFDKGALSQSGSHEEDEVQRNPGRCQRAKAGKTLTSRGSLSQNSPNPFSQATTIHYTIPSAVGGQRAAVNLSIYDLSGRLVRTLVDEPRPTGYSLLPTAVEWDGKDSSGRDVTTGIYIYQLRAAGLVQAKRMIVLK